MVEARNKWLIASLWLVGWAMADALAWPLEARVDAAWDVTKNAQLHAIAWWCSKLAEGWVPVAAGGVVALLFFLLNRPSVAAKIIFVVLTCTVTGLAVDILKMLVGRTRPLAHVPAGFYGMRYDGHWIIGKGEFGSFPSGHSATAVGLAAAAWLVHHGWGTVAIIYALAVMWSRIALQAHHLTDVLASVAVSIPLAILLKPVLLPFVEFHVNHLSRAKRGAKV